MMLRAMPTACAMLGAFNEAMPDWVSFFKFTSSPRRQDAAGGAGAVGLRPAEPHLGYYADRGGVHHMFVGETGVQRIIERTCEAMRAAGISDPTDVERIRALGVVDLADAPAQDEPAFR